MKLTGLFFREAFMLADVVTEVTAGHQIDDEVKIVAVFEGIMHVHQESNKLMR